MLGSRIETLGADGFPSSCPSHQNRLAPTVTTTGVDKSPSTPAGWTQRAALDKRTPGIPTQWNELHAKTMSNRQPPELPLVERHRRGPSTPGRSDRSWAARAASCSSISKGTIASPLYGERSSG